MSRVPHVFLALVAFLAACRDDGLRNAPPPGQRTDSYAQLGASRVDVLWVVDNSGSMEPRQQQLADNFASFMTEFTRNAIQYRIAVTTTDIFKDAGEFKGSPKVLRNNTPSVIEAFKNNIRVGINGSPFEAGMEAARLALEKQRTVQLEREEDAWRRLSEAIAGVLRHA